MLELKAYLSDIENRIDEQTEQDLLDKWKSFAADRSPFPYFKPSRKTRSKSSLDWPDVSLTDVATNFDTLVYKELYRMNMLLETGGTELLSFRSNYGTIIVPSVFGVDIVMMPPEQNSLPSCKPLPDAEGTFRKLIDSGNDPDCMQGYALKCFETARHYDRLLKDYPKLKKYCYIYMPDAEGPSSVLEALFGADVFYLMYDEPELITDSVRIIGNVVKSFITSWFEEFSPISDEFCCNWGFLHRGNFLLREDSATNLSPDLYKEFIYPADCMLMKTFRGGAVHFCGRGDHLIEILSSLPGFAALNISQPEMNDMKKIYECTIRKNSVLIGTAQAEVQRCLDEGVDMMGRVHAGRGIPAWMPDTVQVPFNT